MDFRVRCFAKGKIRAHAARAFIVAHCCVNIIVCMEIIPMKLVVMCCHNPMKLLLKNTCGSLFDHYLHVMFSFSFYVRKLNKTDC